MVATIALDVLKGLEYMHAHSMLHRDVKVCLLSPVDISIMVSDTGCHCWQQHLQWGQFSVNTRAGRVLRSRPDSGCRLRMCSSTTMAGWCSATLG